MVILNIITYQVYLQVCLLGLLLYVLHILHPFFVSFTTFVIFNIDLLIKINNPICAATGLAQNIVRKDFL